MDSVRFQRVMSLFDQACGLDAAERAEFLAGECETTAIREEVEALLAQDDHGPVITSAVRQANSSRLGSKLIRAGTTR